MSKFRQGDIYLLGNTYYLLLKEDENGGFRYVEASSDFNNRNNNDSYFEIKYIDSENKIKSLWFSLNSLREKYLFSIDIENVFSLDKDFITCIGNKGILKYYEAKEKFQDKYKRSSIIEEFESIKGLVLKEKESDNIYLITKDFGSEEKIKIYSGYEVAKGSIVDYDFLCKEFNNSRFHHFKIISYDTYNNIEAYFDIVVDTDSGRVYNKKQFQALDNDNFKVFGKVNKEDLKKFLNLFISESKVDDSEVIIKPSQLYLLNGSTTGAYIEEVNKSTGMIKFKQVEIMLNDVEQEKPAKKRFIYESRELYILMKENNRVFDLGIHTKGMNIELESRHVSLNRYEEMIKKNQLVLYCSDFKI